MVWFLYAIVGRKEIRLLSMAVLKSAGAVDGAWGRVLEGGKPVGSAGHGGSQF